MKPKQHTWDVSEMVQSLIDGKLPPFPIYQDLLYAIAFGKYAKKMKKLLEKQPPCTFTSKVASKPLLKIDYKKC